MKPEQPLPVWGSIDSSVIRVGNRYIDQVKKVGHHDESRISDLDAVASLGIQRIRYPYNWERVAPNGIENADWDWTDKRTERMRTLGITPIVGLLHHGSGPEDTNLLDPQFPDKLATYAAEVSRRYQIDDVIPVNEPLTTARFSTLYGHWYPHVQDDLAFTFATFNQCKAAVRAMQEIRVTNPQARFIVTEDFGRTFSTPELDYQAQLSNKRSFLSYDILTGQVDNNHWLWDYALAVKMDPRILEEFVDFFKQTDIRPDVLGVNRYATSDRFIDQDLSLYPDSLHGGNAQHNYADTEAVRVPQGMERLSEILADLWNRYQTKLAITECHLGDQRVEEQKRWIHEFWQDTQKAREGGIPVEAFTIHALFGLDGWNTLGDEKDDSVYEFGIFDVRSGVPVKTPLADMVEALARTGNYKDTDLDTPGWWRREERILYRHDEVQSEIDVQTAELSLPEQATVYQLPQ